MSKSNVRELFTTQVMTTIYPFCTHSVTLQEERIINLFLNVHCGLHLFKVVGVLPPLVMAWCQRWWLLNTTESFGWNNDHLLQGTCISFATWHYTLDYVTDFHWLWCQGMNPSGLMYEKLILVVNTTKNCYSIMVGWMVFEIVLTKGYDVYMSSKTTCWCSGGNLSWWIWERSCLVKTSNGYPGMLIPKASGLEQSLLSAL